MKMRSLKHTTDRQRRRRLSDAVDDWDKPNVYGKPPPDSSEREQQQLEALSVSPLPKTPPKPKEKGLALSEDTKFLKPSIPKEKVLPEVDGGSNQEDGLPNYEQEGYEGDDIGEYNANNGLPSDIPDGVPPTNPYKNPTGKDAAAQEEETFTIPEKEVFWMDDFVENL